MIIINPGTENQVNATEENAMESIKIFVADLVKNHPQLNGMYIHREPKRDDRGWYGFVLIANDRTVEVDIPGVEPDIFTKSTPFESPRCYVDGSSWLYNFGLSVASDRLLGEEE